MGRLYTIGHSQHKFEYFLSLLQKYDINYLLDVRSTPYSKYAETYNKDKLNYLLNQNHITYWPMGKYFGARREDKFLYSESGYLDFEKVRKSELFQSGVRSVELGLQRGNQIVLMCTEKDPIDCHRAVMVAKAFFDNGIEVYHILSDGKIQTHTELEKRLLNKYYPDRNQLDIFTYNEKLDNNKLLKDAYAKRNEEIGYHYGIEEMQ